MTDKNKKINHYCSNCKCLLSKSEAKQKVVDPYLEEINNEIVKKYMCDSCYHNSLEEI